MYFVVNLCECEIVAECSTYAEASIILVNEVQDSGEFYTEDDFAIMDEEEFEDYSYRN